MPNSFRYKTIVVNGRMQTVPLDDGDPEAAAAKLARDKRELLDMIAGNVQFFDDPLSSTPKPQPTSEEKLRDMGWYSALTGVGYVMSLYWDGREWDQIAFPAPAVSGPMASLQIHRLQGEKRSNAWMIDVQKARIIYGPFSEPTLPTKP